MKLQEKGLICFEEITDYSILTDQKVNFLTMSLLSFKCHNRLLY
jgi:hypothetical protein